MKLQGPQNNGGFSHEGTSYEPDADGCIDVPAEIVGFALSHGFKPIEIAAPATLPAEDGKVDLAKLNKKQLIALAKDTLGIDLDPALKNADMIAQIETAMAAQDPGAE